MSNVVDFPGVKRRPPNPRGTIDIYPCDVDGGSWAVDHMLANGDSGARIGVRFAYDDAVRLARRTAKEMGADFLGGISI